MELDRAFAQVVIDHIDAYGVVIDNILLDLRAKHVNKEPYPINLPNTCEICLSNSSCNAVVRLYLCDDCRCTVWRGNMLDSEVTGPVTVERVRELHNNRPLLIAAGISALACARMRKIANDVSFYNGKCTICRQRGILTSYMLRGIYMTCIRSVCVKCNNHADEVIKQIYDRASYLFLVSKQLRLDNAEIHVYEFLVALVVNYTHSNDLTWVR